MVGNTEHMMATYYFPIFNTHTLECGGCPYEKRNAKKNEMIINKRGYACASPVSSFVHRNTASITTTPGPGHITRMGLNVQR